MLFSNVLNELECLLSSGNAVTAMCCYQRDVQRAACYQIMICDKVFFTLALSGAFAKLRKATISFVMSVRPHGTTGFPIDGF